MSTAFYKPPDHPSHPDLQSKIRQICLVVVSTVNREYGIIIPIESLQNILPDSLLPPRKLDILEEALWLKTSRLAPARAVGIVPDITEAAQSLSPMNYGRPHPGAQGCREGLGFRV